jgi:hypothetical protein
MAERYLDRYREEIIQLHRQRKTQAQIRRHLEDKYDVDIGKTTLSDYMKDLRASEHIAARDDPRVTPEEEHFLEQYEVYQSLQQSSKEILDATARMLARMKSLDDAMRERTEGILTALQGIHDAVHQRPPVQNASWQHALLIGGAFWAVLIVLGAALYFALRG